VSTPATSIVHFTKDPAQQRYVHVLAKRTYRLRPDEAPTPAPEQLAIVSEAVYYDGDEANPPEWEPDLYACPRGGTDVVVQGTAYCPGGPRRELDVSVAVQLAGMTRELALKAARRVRVYGNRSVRWFAGTISFTDPEPFTTMPLSYRLAYGGHDHVADLEKPDDYAVWMAESAGDPIFDHSPHGYARNPLGKGYVVFPSLKALEGLALPNLEMANDLLTPERLVVGNAERWHLAPRPAGFDWHGEDWFSRTGFLGVVPEFEGTPSDVAEVREGLIPAELLEEDGLFEGLGSSHAPGFFRAASPWLRLPEFTGGELIHLDHMHPTIAELEVPMPKEPPQMVLELDGGAARELKAALRTVVIRPDRGELICVWVGTMPVDGPRTEAQLAKTRHAVRWKKGT
jgi:hypothetical protein